MKTSSTSLADTPARRTAASAGALQLAACAARPRIRWKSKAVAHAATSRTRLLQRVLHGVNAEVYAVHRGQLTSQVADRGPREPGDHDLLRRAPRRGALHTAGVKIVRWRPSRGGPTLGAAEVEYAAPRDSCAPATPRGEGDAESGRQCAATAAPPLTVRAAEAKRNMLGCLFENVMRCGCLSCPPPRIRTRGPARGVKGPTKTDRACQVRPRRRSSCASQAAVWSSTGHDSKRSTGAFPTVVTSLWLIHTQ